MIVYSIKSLNVCLKSKYKIYALLYPLNNRQQTPKIYTSLKCVVVCIAKIKFSARAQNI